jgi:hypothetical protein
MMSFSVTGNRSSSDIQAAKYLCLIGHVSDEQPHGRRDVLDQRRHDNNLRRSGLLWMQIKVDDRQFISARQVAITQGPDTLYSQRRSGRQPGNIQEKDVSLLRVIGHPFLDRLHGRLSLFVWYLVLHVLAFLFLGGT